MHAMLPRWWLLVHDLTDSSIGYKTTHSRSLLYPMEESLVLYPTLGRGVDEQSEHGDQGGTHGHKFRGLRVREAAGANSRSPSTIWRRPSTIVPIEYCAPPSSQKKGVFSMRSLRSLCTGRIEYCEWSQFSSTQKENARRNFTGQQRKAMFSRSSLVYVGGRGFFFIVRSFAGQQFDYWREAPE